MKFAKGDTVEVIAHSAFTGEVGEIVDNPSAGIYTVNLPFPGSDKPYHVSFAESELKHTQQKLEGL